MQKILIVDDEETTVQLIEFVLRKNHFVPVCAYSGSKAIELAQQEKPDLILLDIMMPGQDGFEVCAQLKKDHRTKDIPVIFLTALGQETDVERGLRTGANGYIIKPFNPTDLLHQIKVTLAR